MLKVWIVRPCGITRWWRQCRCTMAILFKTCANPVYPLCGKPECSKQSCDLSCYRKIQATVQISCSAFTRIWGSYLHPQKVIFGYAFLRRSATPSWTWKIFALMSLPNFAQLSILLKFLIRPKVGLVKSWINWELFFRHWRNIIGVTSSDPWLAPRGLAPEFLALLALLWRDKAVLICFRLVGDSLVIPW